MGFASGELVEPTRGEYVEPAHAVANFGFLEFTLII